MKNTIRALLTACLLVGTSVGLQAGLVNRYSFNDGTANDSVGGQNGSIQGTAAVSGGGLQLDGSGYVTLPSGLVSALNSFTIESWFTWNDASSWNRVFDFGSNTSSYMFFTTQNSYTGTPRFAITTAGNQNEEQVTGSAALVQGSPTFVAVTYDAASTTATLYVNGATVASNSSVTVAPSLLSSTTSNYLGKSQFADPNFQGSIDEFRIYDAALTSTGISADAVAGPNALLVPTPEPATYSLIGVVLVSSTFVRRLRRN